MDCQNTDISLPYPPIGNTKRARGMISGFAVDSFRNGIGSNSAFGIALKKSNAGSSSLTLTVYIIGRAYLTSVSVYYFSF